jgi:hypothetical protein
MEESVTSQIGLKSKSEDASKAAYNTELLPLFPAREERGALPLS